jgi:putative transposase
LERTIKAYAYGLPKVICVDNGLEFAGRALDQWAHQRRVKLRFSRPGKLLPRGHPDNAMIETVNAKVRLECLNQNWFESLEEAKMCLEQWRREYNQERPHSALRNQTPAKFVAQWRHEQQLKKAAA